MMAATLSGGFADPPRDAARAFRAVMNVMARPGTIEEIAGAEGPCSSAAACVLLTLCDPDTGIWLAPSVDTPQMREWLAFHTGAPVVAAAIADFALGRWDEMPLEEFPLGTAEYPDRSTTLVVEVDGLAAEGATLRGPGIAETARLNVPDVAFCQRNASRFPLGLDLILTAGDRIAALPRSTEVS